MAAQEQVTIRPAGARDVPAMADLLGQLFAIEADFAIDRTLQERGLFLLLERTSPAGGVPPGGVVLLAERVGRVVGMCSVQTLISTAEGGPVGLVEDLVVADGCRGAGIGQQLLGAIEEWSRRVGLSRLQLLADRTNESGLGFYERNGWLGTQLTCLRKKEQR